MTIQYFSSARAPDAPIGGPHGQFVRRLFVILAVLGATLWLVGSSTITAAQPTFITDGLIAYYPLNGNGNDESGNGNNATIVRGVFANDRFGDPNTAVLLRGSSEIGVAHLNFALSYSGAATISGWIKFRSLAGRYPRVMSLMTTCGEWDFGVSGADSGDPQFLHPAAFNAISCQYGDSARSPDSLNLGIWSHIVITQTSGTTIGYLDGKQFGKVTVTLNGLPFSQPGFKVGNALTDSSEVIPWGTMDAVVDDYRVYNRALTASEVKALFEYESVPHPQNPTTATATALIVNGFVVGATITDGGSGYTNSPNVSIVGGNGSGATAVASVVNGAVTTITILNAGHGYTGIPTFVFDPPPHPPTQAQGTATVINSFVTQVVITDGGHGYGNTAPPVHFIGGGGTGAIGVATVQNGIVTGVTITATGSGYTTPPRVLIAAPSGVPLLEIEVSQVRVNLLLIAGYTYKIQTSTNGSSWTDTGPQFLATDATASRLFDVTSSSQLFRVVQMP